MLRVPVADSSYTDVTITLSAVRYTFVYRFNEREERWRFDVYDADDVLIYAGLKILEGTSPDIHLENLSNDGFLQVVQLENDDDLARRNNVGIGKSYELIYTTFQELNELGN